MLSFKKPLIHCMLFCQTFPEGYSSLCILFTLLPRPLNISCLVLFCFLSAKRNQTTSDRIFYSGQLQGKTTMTIYILEKALSSPSLSSCLHHKGHLNELGIPPSRGASLTSKSDILPMHFMLTTCIKSEVGI